MQPQKNHKILIRAFIDIHRKYPDYKLIIYGDGPLRDKLQRQIDDAGLNLWVLLPGKSKTIIYEMQKAAIFVLSSNYEGQSNALLEAMYVGLPVISTKVSGAIDIIDNTNGILVDIGDVEGITNAIDLLLSNKIMADSMGMKASKTTEAFDEKKIVDKWRHIIDKIIEVNI